MLTHPSDSLPHLGFLMEEDALPTIPLCSAPPPPLLPPSSVTPRCVNDGISGSRRSGCIEEGDATEQGASENQDSGSMVQVSESKHPRVESSDGRAAGKQGDLDFSAASQCQNKKKGQGSPAQMAPVFTVENLEKQLADADLATAADPCHGDVDMKDLDTTLAAKSWVISPLFQSLKSKMASFTEIVMSPAKLFRPNSPSSPPDTSPEKFSSEQQLMDDESFWSPLGSDVGSERAVCSRKLAFDVDPCGDQREEPKENSEPSPPPLISSDQITSSEPLVDPSPSEEDRPIKKVVFRDPVSETSDLEVNFELRSQTSLVRADGVDSSSGPAQSGVVREEVELRRILRTSKTASQSKRTSTGSHQLTQRKRLKVEDSVTALSDAATSAKPQKKKVVSPDSTSGKEVKPKSNLSTRAQKKTEVTSSAIIVSQDKSTGQTEVKQRRGRQKDSALCRSVTAAKDAEVMLSQPPAEKVPANKKPQKRKLGGQVGSGSAPFVECNSSASDPLKQAEGPKSEVKQASKKPKKESRAVLQRSDGERRSGKSAKDGLRRGGRAEPVYFEMTPFSTDSCVKEDKDASLPSVTPDSSGSGNIHRCSRKQGRSKKAGLKGTAVDEQVSSSVTLDDAALPSSRERGFSKRLSRSFSCPEIPSLCSRDALWTSPLSQPRVQSSLQLPCPQGFPAPLVSKAARRARRHTVCSLEVEREIAPLCLRKEVYPSRRSIPYDKATQHFPPTVTFSPSSSLSALASSFLTSPLAFLSRREASCSHMTSASSSPASVSSSVWLLSGFHPSSDPGSSRDASGSVNPLERPVQRRAQGGEEEEEGENTSSSSPELEDASLREEKALSDSEIKVVQAQKERGKVSSIRIRKALPKRQNNLTPMGLPKTIRVKKKEFTLEEIYTNKNFSQPPESRLETIFEVPLSRRNGLESCFSQKRVKRFLQFPEVGLARKPKKPLVGLGKSGTSTTSRTRRGGFAAPSLTPQDAEALLCAKLDQLGLWLAVDQRDSWQTAPPSDTSG